MIRSKRNRSWLFATFVIVFFAYAAAGNVAHATKYGSAPHNHDNKVCVISLMGDEEQDNLALPPADISVTPPTCSYVYSGQPASMTWLLQTIESTARAPPGQ